MASKRRFQLVLLKPSHYDDNGYVIRWWRALIPSNSLAAVYGLALDSAERRALGDDVEIDIDVIDETNTRVDIDKLIRRFRKHGNFGLLGLVGVQSNQYPRARTRLSVRIAKKLDSVKAEKTTAAAFPPNARSPKVNGISRR